MYQWLLKHTNRRRANFLIFLWYLLLTILVIYSLNFEPGRFRYLHW